MPARSPVLSIPAKDRISLHPLTICAICNTEFLPDKKNCNHQKFCSQTCRKRAKKKRDKPHKLAYRKKDKYRSAKSAQNRRYRIKKKWPEYMRQYREEHIESTKRQNRSASKKYYQKNRRIIAFRRSELRWQKKLRAEIEVIKKISP